ncbi:MAG: Gfo/Idh/MocA family oxidoreductase [Chloroflexi bacterium]|nr:Gfo/Idh/MocA family oxidoreductase [Chloroflexota bacterium]
MRYLVVGLGNIGQKRRALLGERCVATVDPYNGTADYGSVEACSPDAYDAAVLAVPNETKLPLLEHLLAQGKHVLLEKPLLLPDRSTAERLDALARSHGAIWYTSYNHRFEPLMQRLREHLRANAIGRLYYGRFFYGNGTVQNVVGTWRDGGLGVAEDLGSHLLDLVGFLLDRRGENFEPLTLEHHEARGFDHCILASGDRSLVLEASYLSWKNTFTIDLVGEGGALHLSGLPKWGPSSLVLRNRVRPSGAPTEAVETAEPGRDLTWERDIAHFESIVGEGRTSMENDWWISRTLAAIQPVAA